MTLVGGPSCHSDVATSSNVPGEADGPVMDRTLVMAPSSVIMGVATTSGMAQVATLPVAPLELAGHRAGTDLATTHPVSVEAAPRPTLRSFAPLPIVQGKVTTTKR
jgi:hypothetical protein